MKNTMVPALLLLVCMMILPGCMNTSTDEAADVPVAEPVVAPEDLSNLELITEIVENEKEQIAVLKTVADAASAEAAKAKVNEHLTRWKELSVESDTRQPSTDEAEIAALQPLFKQMMENVPILLAEMRRVQANPETDAVLGEIIRAPMPRK